MHIICFLLCCVFLSRFGSIACFFHSHDDFLMQFQSYVNSLGCCRACLFIIFAAIVQYIVCGSFLLSVCSSCRLSEAEINNQAIDFYVMFLAASDTPLSALQTRKNFFALCPSAEAVPVSSHYSFVHLCRRE